MKFFLVLITSTVVLVGCATTEKYGQILDSWMGSNIEELMNSWGYPGGSFDSPNGNKVYVYSNTGSYTTPVTTSTVDGIVTTHGGYTLNFSCTTYIETDAFGTIVTWSWKGNNCVAY